MKIWIATAKNRFSKRWKNKEVYWDEFVEQLSAPTLTAETKAEYKKMSRMDKAKVKDVGGFVGGKLRDGIRKDPNVISRSLLTLDLDHVDSDSVLELIDLTLDCGYVVYSTHSHTPEKPKYRLIIPLDKEVDSERYQAIGRMVANDIGIDYFDDTTYQASRLMYFPSCSKDAKEEYVYEVKQGVTLDTERYLSRYDDWTDISFWPISSRQQEIVKKLGKEQEDPLLKEGVIGAFCRAYSISEAISAFLDEVYEACDKAGRYTYTEGSSSAGAVVYDDKFLYSNHATDPASMKLCNAFDLVRIHKFSNLDEDSKLDTPVNKLPSFIAMQEFATSLPDVKQLLGEERLRKAQAEFQEELDGDKEEINNLEWMSKLEYDKKGRIVESGMNCKIILENDSNLQGILGYDSFRSRVVMRHLPWRKVEKDTISWSDEDDADLRLYYERVYGLKVNRLLQDAFMSVMSARRFHPIRRYLESLEWDGNHRLETLFIDYLGAVEYDNGYTKAVTRKALIAAIKRVFEPGCKFDYMTVFYGAQGLGKSTILSKLGMEWYSDSVTAITGKESYEQIIGNWIVEMGELASLKKQEVEHIKLYISKCEDRFRKAFARNITDNPRQCVFFGTTNEQEFLIDRTGNRRFWPINCDKKATKDIFKDLTQEEVNQIWAEAMWLYRNTKEPMYLEEKAIREQAEKLQQEHHVRDYREELIIDFLQTRITSDWYTLDSNEHIQMLKNEDLEMEVEREKVCALEVWVEALECDKTKMTNADRKFIQKVIESQGWIRSEKAIKFNKTVGVQRGYRRGDLI